jgi:hypothetical protein
MPTKKQEHPITAQELRYWATHSNVSRELTNKREITEIYDYSDTQWMVVKLEYTGNTTLVAQTCNFINK